MAKPVLTVRISPEASLKLAWLVEARGWKSNGVAIEALIMAEPGPATEVWLAKPSVDLSVGFDGQLARGERERKERVVPPPAVQRMATRQGIDPNKVAAAQDWLKKPGRKK